MSQQIEKSIAVLELLVLLVGTTEVLDGRRRTKDACQQRQLLNRAMRQSASRSRTLDGLSAGNSLPKPPRPVAPAAAARMAAATASRSGLRTPGGPGLGAAISGNMGPLSPQEQLMGVSGDGDDGGRISALRGELRLSASSPASRGGAGTGLLKADNTGRVAMAGGYRSKRPGRRPNPNVGGRAPGTLSTGGSADNARGRPVSTGAAQISTEEWVLRQELARLLAALQALEGRAEAAEAAAAALRAELEEERTHPPSPELVRAVQHVVTPPPPPPPQRCEFATQTASLPQAQSREAQTEEAWPSPPPPVRAEPLRTSAEQTELKEAQAKVVELEGRLAVQGKALDNLSGERMRADEAEATLKLCEQVRSAAAALAAAAAADRDCPQAEAARGAGGQELARGAAGGSGD